MAYETFSTRLNELIRDAGMRPSEVADAVEQSYAKNVQVTRQDLSKYLAGDSLPRLNKLAAICDVCAATHSQIASLVRSTVERS